MTTSSPRRAALRVDHALMPDNTVRACALTFDPQGRIEQVLHDPDEISALKQVEHLPDVLLTPAFINAHTHLPMACFRGLDLQHATRDNLVEDLFFHVESHMLPEEIAAFAKLGAYESLLYGVGLVWEHYYAGLKLAEAIAATGLCAVVAPTLQDLSGPGVISLDRQLQATLDLGSPGWAERGIWPALGPHATDTVSAELWGSIVELAERHALPIHIHVAQSLEEYERAEARHQMSPMEILEARGALSAEIPHALLAHAIFTSRSDLLKLDPERHTVAFCPFAQLIFAFPAHARRFMQAGVPIAVATDSAASNDAMNVQKELRFVAGLRTSPASSHQRYEEFFERPSAQRAALAWSERQRAHAEGERLSEEAWLLDTVWRTPGRMHPAFRAGQIAPGQLANLIAWDRRHVHLWPPRRPLRALSMGDPTQAIVNMMTLGKWIGTHHNYHASLLGSEAYAEALAEASSRFSALRRRAGLR